MARAGVCVRMSACMWSWVALLYVGSVLIRALMYLCPTCGPKWPVSSCLSNILLLLASALPYALPCVLLVLMLLYAMTGSPCYRVGAAAWQVSCCWMRSAVEFGATIV